MTMTKPKSIRVDRAVPQDHADQRERETKWRKLKRTISLPLRMVTSTPAFKWLWTNISHRKVVLWIAFSTCCTVFLTNLVLAIVSYTHLSNTSPDSYIRDVYSGDCSVVGRADTGVHLAINVLSTGMLWASNLAMQLVGSPTRKLIDEAHEQGEWLDIGIVSFHNLRSVPRANLVVWILLASSSLPIHFL